MVTFFPLKLVGSHPGTIILHLLIPQILWVTCSIDPWIWFYNVIGAHCSPKDFWEGGAMQLWGILFISASLTPSTQVWQIAGAQESDEWKCRSKYWSRLTFSIFSVDVFQESSTVFHFFQTGRYITLLHQWKSVQVKPWGVQTSRGQCN
jgi:hypothetical protein